MIKRLLIRVLYPIFLTYYKIKIKLMGRENYERSLRASTPLFDDETVEPTPEPPSALESLFPDPTEAEHGGKVVTMFLPSEDGLTVAAFPVNKYMARILDADDDLEPQYKQFKSDAYREIISICMAAQEYADGSDDEEGDIFL